MNFLIIFILEGLLQFSKSQWQSYVNYLTKNTKFSYDQGKDFYEHTGNFLISSNQSTANFITCTSPETSYITLNQIYPSAQHYFSTSIVNEQWILMDLFFHGTWLSENVEFRIGQFSYSYSYTSPTTYPMKIGFCDSIPFEVKTLNFSISQTVGRMNFTSSNQNQGFVSLRNIFIYTFKCYPSCISCTGPKQNECTRCYYGLPTNNICPPCPINQYQSKYQTCRDICDIDSPLYSNGFCKQYPINLIEAGDVDYDVASTDNLRWNIKYDEKHLDLSPTPTQKYPEFYGTFKFNSGIYRYFNKLSTYIYSTYLVGFKIDFITFNDIPMNCGIQFKINNTYYGSIYRNASGIQTHRFKIFDSYEQSSFYNQSMRYHLIAYFDIPKYSVLFSAIGNYTDDTAGWGIILLKITSGYCPSYCLLCE
ncbi:unnamed protein product, partial (macronuclear) [Paramecium tetraurelia]